MDEPAAELPWFLTELDSATVDPALPVVAALETADTIRSGGGSVTVVRSDQNSTSTPALTAQLFSSLSLLRFS